MNAETEQQLEPDAIEASAGAEQFRCAYFYYVTPPGPAPLHVHANVEVFVMQANEIGPSAKIEDLIPVWAQKAKDGQLTPVGWGLGDLRWRKRNHFVVVVNVPGYHLASEEALVITDGKKTFTNKTLINITTADGTRMQAIHCRNHVQRDDGTPLQEGDLRLFDPLRLELTHTTGGLYPLRTHDDVGTNIGPRKP